MSVRVPKLIAATLAILAALAASLAFAGSASAAGPTAIATDSDGVVYSGYASGGFIQRNQGSDGAALSSWGTAGSNPGQLGGIVAIDVAPGSGNVWILDTNRRVQEFSRSGTYIRGFQLEACDPGISPDPLLRGGLDVTNDMIYVVHPCADRVYRYEKSSLDQKAWTADVAGPLKGASAQLYSSAPNNSQYLFVTRPTKNDIVWFDLDSLGWHGPKNIGGSPSDLFVDAYGVVMVSDTTNNTIRFYDSDLNEFRTLGGTGSALGKLNAPAAFDVFEQFSDLSGNLFIADTGNQRIQRWNSYGYTFWGATANGGTTVSAPVNTTAPAVSPGTATTGTSLSCSRGSWTQSPTSYVYRWRRNGTNIAGATTQNYTVVAADVGQAITCTVTAMNSAGAASAASSNTVTPTAATGAPGNTSVPTISGSAVVGGTLSCAPGTWTGNPTNYTYRWKRNGGATPIATGQNYTVVAADVGQAITCEVQATNASGTGTATSAAVTPTSTPPVGGDAGVTINNAAIATNSPGVTLTIHEPSGATAVKISNDGGFGAATSQAIRGDDTYTWTLQTSGAERLPKTVYVRFSGGGNDGNQTYTDDIILDQRPPLALAAALSGKTLKVRARDSGTGVSKVQYTKKPGSKKIVTRDYTRKLRVKSKRKVRFARFVDGADNYSAWKPIKRKHKR